MRKKPLSIVLSVYANSENATVPTFFNRLRFRSGQSRFVPLYGTDEAVPFHEPQTKLLEPMIRIELMTSPLPRECSTN